MVVQLRKTCAISPDEGPTDTDISNAIDNFAGQFDYWYDRVMAHAVPKYRDVVISRINPFVRGIEFQAMSPPEAADNLVRDYANRNFVTAGGWAIEAMAIALGGKNSKAAATGIDLHKIDPATGAQHLYVIKSGKVTRNSDILAALKRHAAQAQKLLIQGGSKVQVFANYAVAAGATESTYSDHVHRPSSARFWSEVTELDEDKAMMLAYEVSKAAANIIRREAQPHIEAMKLLVGSYIADPKDATRVDWAFLFDRSMKTKAVWKDEDAMRHQAGMTRLTATAYTLIKPQAKSKPKAPAKPAKKVKSAKLP